MPGVLRTRTAALFDWIEPRRQDHAAMTSRVEPRSSATVARAADDALNPRARRRPGARALRYPLRLRRRARTDRRTVARLRGRRRRPARRWRRTVFGGGRTAASARPSRDITPRGAGQWAAGGSCEDHRRSTSGCVACGELSGLRLNGRVTAELANPIFTASRRSSNSTAQTMTPRDRPGIVAARSAWLLERLRIRRECE